MWGELLVRDSPVSPHPWGRIRVRQPRLRAAPWARGRRALLDTRGQPRCSTVALPAGVSQAGWITRCPCRCPARGLGEQAGPNLRAPSRDPTRIWRCRSLVPPALCPGEASAPRACATAGVGRDLELWPPNTTARSLLGSPSVAQWVGWERAAPQIQGSSSFLAMFSPARRPRSRRGRRVPAGSPGHGAAPAAAQHRGLSLSRRAAGDRHTEPLPDPRVPPCPALAWQRLGAGGSGNDTAVAAGSAPGPVSERGWGLAWGLSPERCWGAGGRGRAGAGPCPPALRHRCSPNTPDLKRRFQPGAGGRGPVPPAPVTHPPGAWHPGRAPAPPHPAWMPRGCSPGRQPPTMGPAGPRSRRRSTIGSCLGAAAPAAWAAHSCPRPPLRPRGSGGPDPAPSSPRRPQRARGDAGPRCPSSGARCQSGSSFAACRGGSRGSHDPGNPSEAVGSSPGDKRRPPDPRRFLRGPELGVPRGRGGVGDPLSPRCPHSLHRHRHETAASLQPREPLRDPAAPLPGLPGGPGQPGAHLLARRRRHRLPQGAQRENTRSGGKDGGPAGP